MDIFIKKLNRIEEWTAGDIFLGLAVFTFIETVLRYTISYTFPWFQEFANYMLIFGTYLGASIGVKYGTHFSMEALTEYAPDRLSHALKSLAYFVSGLAVILFIFYGVKHIQAVIGFGVKSPAMQIPMYIPYIAIPLFSVTMSFRFFVLSYQHLRKFINNDPYEKVHKR